MNLSIDKLTKKFNEQIVIDELSFKVENINSLAIIGPSGGGKSTLLRILAGLENPNGGAITLENEIIDFNEQKLKEYRKHISVVFQSYNLFPHLTALENITLPLVLVYKKSKKEAQVIALELLERFQLKDHIQKHPYQLSGGQKQRVAIARALAFQTKLLLLDEPTSALDPELTNEVLDMINEIQSEHNNLIVVTHEMGFAKKSCDYTMFISDGKVIEHGYSNEMFENPKTKELKNFFSSILEWNV